jgi:hypothetical protein
MQTRIDITKNQADAIRADITEINQMQQILQLKMQANKRMTDTIVLDADKKPADYKNYELEEKGGKTVMVLHPADPDPALMAEPQAPVNIASKKAK